MNSKNNLAISVDSQSQIIPMGIVTSKEAFNKFYANFSVSSWDNKVIATSNFLSLPIATCMNDKSLKLLDKTHGATLGHKTLEEFVCAEVTRRGLGLEWEQWTLLVNSMIKKLEFGINASSPEDVLLQIEDVTNKLGREPVSKFEFSLAKDEILQEQVNRMQDEHQGVVSEMRGKVSELMLKLEDERKEKLTAIEKLDSALSQINELSQGSQQVDLQNYVERSLYDKIVEEIGELQSHHESLLQKYLDRITRLTVTNKSHIARIRSLQSLIERRNEEIAALSGGMSNEVDEETFIEYKHQIDTLKQQVVSLLKRNIQKQKVINKQKIISAKKTQINTALRTHNQRLTAQAKKVRLSRPQSRKVSFFESAIGTAIICTTLSISFLTSLYTLF